MLSGGMGMPTEPFVVWGRPHSAAANWQPLTISQKQLLFLGLFELVTWSQGSIVERERRRAGSLGRHHLRFRGRTAFLEHLRGRLWSRPETRPSSFPRTSSTVSWSRRE